MYAESIGSHSDFYQAYKPSDLLEYLADQVPHRIQCHSAASWNCPSAALILYPMYLHKENEFYIFSLLVIGHGELSNFPLVTREAQVFSSKKSAPT